MRLEQFRHFADLRRCLARAEYDKDRWKDEL